MLWMVWMAVSNAAGLAGVDLDWVCVNDTVMGGVSDSAVTPDGDAVVFTGNLSLEQNGGFTSVRTRPAALPLAGVTGFRLTLQGDGRTYDFTARRDDVPIRGGSYRVAVETVADEVVEVEVALSSFQATSFGRPISNAPPLALAPERIDSLGFLLADGQPGAFSLTILAIEPLVGPDPVAAVPVAPAAVGRDAVSATFNRAIARGVPRFNQGDPATCAVIYQTAIESVLLLAGSALTEAERSALLGALQAAASQDPAPSAWTLRTAMDAVLARS